MSKERRMGNCPHCGTMHSGECPPIETDDRMSEALAKVYEEMSSVKSDEARIAELKAERDRLRARCAELVVVLLHARDKFTEMAAMCKRAALSSNGDRVLAVVAAANALRRDGWTMTRENALYEALARMERPDVE